MHCCHGALGGLRSAYGKICCVPARCPDQSPEVTQAYLLPRKLMASSASSASTSSWLSVVPGAFHGKGLSGLSGAGKSWRSASRKPRISAFQAIWLLFCGAPEAMPRASRGVLIAGHGERWSLVSLHSGERCQSQQNHRATRALPCPTMQSASVLPYLLHL